MNIHQASSFEGQGESGSSGLSWIKSHLKEKNVDPLDTRDDLSVGLKHQNEVPIRGSVHISSGRTISRKKMNWLFLFPFLYKKIEFTDES